MDEVVEGPIPVTSQTADLLRDSERARTIVKLVSDILRPACPDSDPLAVFIAELRAAAHAGGLIDAELAA